MTYYYLPLAVLLLVLLVLLRGPGPGRPIRVGTRRSSCADLERRGTNLVV